MVAKTAAGTAEGERDQVRAVGEAQDRSQQPRQHEAHEEREAEQQRHAPAAVLGPLDAVEEAERDGEERDEAERRMRAAHERELHLHAEPAPAIVGSIDSASRKYVLRRTRFWASAGVAAVRLPGSGIRVAW
jgi:hypothetical protein